MLLFEQLTYVIIHYITSKRTLTSSYMSSSIALVSFIVGAFIVAAIVSAIIVFVQIMDTKTFKESEGRETFSTLLFGSVMIIVFGFFLFWAFAFMSGQSYHQNQTFERQPIQSHELQAGEALSFTSVYGGYIISTTDKPVTICVEDSCDRLGTQSSISETASRKEQHTELSIHNRSDTPTTITIKSY